jgi:hypothetical protein
MRGIVFRLTDSITSTTTAELPVRFSAETVRSAFVMAPTKTLAFDSLHKQIQPTNQDAFPFEYEFFENGVPRSPAREGAGASDGELAVVP